MSTRCQVEFYDLCKKPRRWELDARLYHHCDGYPAFMYPTIRRFLKAIKEILKREGHPYWWDSERVSSLFVALSRGKYEEPKEKPTRQDPAKNLYGSVPRFQVSQELHGDIEYLYKVKLGAKDGEAQIGVHKAVYNKEYEITGFRKLTDAQLKKELKRKF